MPRFRVPTDGGTFEVETDVEDPTPDELLSLVSQTEAEEPAKPGLLKRGAAFTARVGLPLAAGAGGFLLGGPVGAAGAAAAGGATGEAFSEWLLGEDFDPTEIAISGALSAVPAGPFGKAAAKPGLSIARQIALHAAEGATQGALASEVESVVKRGELAGIPQLAGGAAGGAVLGGATGAVVGRFARTKRGVEVKETVDVPVESPPEIDTRGLGVFYHGTSRNLEQVSSTHYSGRNVYGEGFYTTDDFTTAGKYQKKGRGDAPQVYRVTEAAPVHFYDLDAPVDPFVLATLKEQAAFSESIAVGLGELESGRITSLGQVFDEARRSSRGLEESADDLTEAFDSIRFRLEGQGFGGFTHTGGRLTQSGREHTVRIYWTPENQLGITRVEPSGTPVPDAAAEDVAASVATAASSGQFTRVPGLGGEVPPKSDIPGDRIPEMLESVDRLFPHLGEVERLSLKETIATHGDDILERTRSTQSHERTEALAQELVLDLSRPLPKGTALNAEQMRNVVDVIGPLQERVTGLAGEVTAHPENDVLKLQLEQATTRLTNAVFSYGGARAEAGRTLNILRVQAGALASGDSKAILAARSLGIDGEQIAKIIAATPGDAVSQYKQIRDMARPDWRDKVRWYYYTNILSGPQTHARNLVSNVVNLALRPVTTPFAAAASKARAALTGTEQEVFAGELPIQAVQMYKALPEAWSRAAFMFKNGFTLNDVQDFEVRPPEIGGGVVTNVIGRSLGAADEFFKQIGFNMELHAGAFSRARKQAKAEGLAGQDLVDRTSALTAELLDSKPSDLLEQASRFSDRVTFQERDNPVAKGMVAFRDAFGPAGSFLVPFVRTPANIFRQGMHFSPAGLLMKGADSKTRAGQQRIGEAVLGSALLMPVAWLASTDRITGAAPTDAGDRDAFYASGKRPNSIRVGDTWVSYSEAGPLVLPFAVVANAYSAYRRSGEVNVGAITSQVARSTLELSYLSSLASVFEAVNDPDRYGGAFVQNLTSGLIPGVGALRNATRATDPNVRQADTIAEGFERNIPGLSRNLLPKLDALGQPIEHPTGAAALVVPQLSAVRTDPVREELAEIGVTPEPLRRTKDVKVGESRMKLDPPADFALRRATGAFRLLLLRELFASPDYQASSLEDRAKAADRAIRQAGTAAMNGVKGLLREGQPVTFDGLTEGLPDPEIAEMKVGGK